MQANMHACRVLDRALCAALAVLVASCEDEGAPTLDVVLDATRGETHGFQPKSAFAEYVEVDDLRHEVRVTLASYETSCDEYRAPEEDDVVVTLVLMSPPDKPPAAMDYLFGGLPDLQAPIEEPVVLPKARVGSKSHLFQPGGSVKLTAVTLEPRGSLEGRVDLSYPGDADHPATRLQGRFSAWICRHAPAPKR